MKRFEILYVNDLRLTSINDRKFDDQKTSMEISCLDWIEFPRFWRGKRYFQFNNSEINGKAK